MLLEIMQDRGEKKKFGADSWQTTPVQLALWVDHIPRCFCSQGRVWVNRKPLRVSADAWRRLRREDDTRIYWEHFASEQLYICFLWLEGQAGKIPLPFYTDLNIKWGSAELRYKTWFKGTYCGNLAKYVRGSFASLSWHKLINNKRSYERLPKKQIPVWLSRLDHCYWGVLRVGFLIITQKNLRI